MADRSVSVSLSSKVAGDKPTRDSLGKASSSKSREMNLPHYLQASSGSCHDFCKYGKHHEFEKKPWLQFQTRGKKTPGAKHFSVEFPEEMKKKANIKLKHQPDSKTHVLDTPDIIDREVSTKSVNMQTLTAKKTSEAMLTKEVQRSVKRVTAKKKTPVQQLNSSESKSSVSSRVYYEKKSLSIHGKKKGPSDLPRTSSDLKSGFSSLIRKQNTSATSERLEVFLKPASMRLEEVHLSPKHTIHSKKILSSADALKLSSGGRNSNIKMGPRTRMPRIMVKKGQASPRGSFSPRSSGSRVPRKVSSRTSINGVTRGFSFPRASLSSKVSLSRVARGFLSPGISLASKMSLSRNASLNAKKQGGPKISSPPKIQSKIEKDGKANADRPKGKNLDPGHPISNLKEPNHDMAQEKTSYVIKMETDSNCINSDINEEVAIESSPPSSSSSPRDSSLPNYPSSPVHNNQDNDKSENSSAEVNEEANSDYDESECAKDAVALEGAHRGRHRNGRLVVTEDKDGPPVKLRFRRGKVVDLLSESRSPRRIKFRRGRGMGENKNLKNHDILNFKRTEADGNANDSQESEKVVLRHQDVQGKKYAQGLFNNVIEETASKLVETRKSKVKALVGAFETVISLQDNKPSSNIIS